MIVCLYIFILSKYVLCTGSPLQTDASVAVDPEGLAIITFINLSDRCCAWSRGEVVERIQRSLFHLKSKALLIRYYKKNLNCMFALNVTIYLADMISKSWLLAVIFKALRLKLKRMTNLCSEVHKHDLERCCQRLPDSLSFVRDKPLSKIFRRRQCNLVSQVSVMKATQLLECGVFTVWAVQLELKLPYQRSLLGKNLLTDPFIILKFVRVSFISGDNQNGEVPQLSSSLLLLVRVVSFNKYILLHTWDFNGY